MKAKVEKGCVRFVNELTEILKALLRKLKNDRLPLGHLGNKISLMLGSKKNCLKKEIYRKDLKHFAKKEPFARR